MRFFYFGSVYVGSTCLSGKQVVSVVVDSYKSAQKFNGASSAAWYVCLYRCSTPLYIKWPKPINLYNEEIIVWIRVEP